MFCLPEEQAAENKWYWRLCSMAARYSCPATVNEGLGMMMAQLSLFKYRARTRMIAYCSDSRYETRTTQRGSCEMHTLVWGQTCLPEARKRARTEPARQVSKKQLLRHCFLVFSPLCQR